MIAALALSLVALFWTNLSDGEVILYGLTAWVLIEALGANRKEGDS